MDTEPTKMNETVNFIGNEGALTMSEALKVNTTLTKLNLTGVQQTAKCQTKTRHKQQ